MKFAKQSFEGGLSMQFDPSRIGGNEYPLLFNGRCRDGVIRPVRKPLECTNCPEGKYQGIYAAGRYALLIAGGRAYIKDFDVAGNFNRVPDLQLDPDVDVIYAEAVPISTRNFLRVPVSDNKNYGVFLTSPLGQSAATVILQDGINRPWLVKADGTGRPAKNYAQWTIADPEYVPIGRQMLHDNGILYIVSPDGTQIYRMCTGQPLNGMVNITVPDGDKHPTNAEGGAQTVSHAVGFDVITCLAALNTPDSAFFAGTKRLGAMVVPDFVNTIFGEPEFDNLDVFPVGPVNQFSFVETNGDYMFVTSKGIRSFNATLSLRNESRNVPFSRRIQRLFKGITQTNPAIGKYDDYVLFSVKTVYGDRVVIYDETLEKFVSVDHWTGVGRVKQFATVTTTSREVLLFIDDNNKLWEYENGEGVETGQLYLGEFVPEAPDANHGPQMLYVSVENAESAGTLTVTPYVDRKRQSRVELSEPITSNRAPDGIPLTVPFGDDTKTNVQVIPFNLGRLPQGRKVGFMLSLNCAAEISSVLLDSSDETQLSGLKSEVAKWARTS